MSFLSLQSFTVSIPYKQTHTHIQGELWLLWRKPSFERRYQVLEYKAAVEKFDGKDTNGMPNDNDYKLLNEIEEEILIKE